jgi:hypothetical protein
MDTPTIQENIEKLRSSIIPYSNTNKRPSFNFSSFNFSSFKLNIYLLIPVIVLLFLAIIRPSFVKNEYVNDSGEKVNEVSYKKIFLYWIILCFILIIGIFGYNYNKKNSNRL